jgi:hypothetical protein
METIKSKLLKIKALAERGIQGERENAQILLEKLLKHYHVTLDELAEEKQDFYTYHYKNVTERKLLVQVIVYVHKTSEVKMKVNYKSRYFRLEQTQLQHLETLELYNIYRKAFDVELERLFVAFIHKHNLFSGEKSNNSDKMSRQELLRIANMMQSMQEVKIPMKRNLLSL